MCVCMCVNVKEKPYRNAAHKNSFYRFYAVQSKQQATICIE